PVLPLHFLLYQNFQSFLSSYFPFRYTRMLFFGGRIIRFIVAGRERAQSDHWENLRQVHASCLGAKPSMCVESLKRRTSADIATTYHHIEDIITKTSSEDTPAKISRRTKGSSSSSISCISYLSPFLSPPYTYQQVQLPLYVHPLSII